MKTSLVIPCTPNHFANNLFSVLKSYENGTVEPDEVIISLSQSPLLKNYKIDPEYLKYFSLCSKGEVFKKFKIISHKEKKTHGPNRQAGSVESTGDVIIYGDADDLAHPQRVEIIKYFFKNYDIVHLNHRWAGDIKKSKNFILKDIKHFSSNELHAHYFSKNGLKGCVDVSKSYGGGVMDCTTTGHVSIRKEVLKKIGWKDWQDLWAPAEDYEFCMETLYTFNKSILIDVPLIEYSNAGWMNELCKCEKKEIK